MRIEFDWDPAKAAGNIGKHGVSFDEAMAVFLDPLALSRRDEDSIGEERWVTVGQGRDARLLLVVHTFVEIAAELAAVRIISARRPSRQETRQYQEGTAR